MVRHNQAAAKNDSIMAGRRFSAEDIDRCDVSILETNKDLKDKTPKQFDAIVKTNLLSITGVEFWFQFAFQILKEEKKKNQKQNCACMYHLQSRWL